MNLEAEKEKIRRYCVAINSEDWPARVVEFFDDPAEREWFLEEHARFRQAFADYHFESEGMVAEGDTIVLYGTVTARHVAEFPYGELKGLPGTGKSVAWKEVWIYRFDGDRVVGFQLIGDGVSRMQQLGVLPPA